MPRSAPDIALAVIMIVIVGTTATILLRRMFGKG